jgi:hypothetical protein
MLNRYTLLTDESHTYDIRCLDKVTDSSDTNSGNLNPRPRTRSRVLSRVILTVKGFLVLL